jgi:DNA-binding FadR family transcriptional regulator
VGRPTLREAIVTLRAVGLLEVRHGEGTFAVNRTGEFLVKALSWARSARWSLRGGSCASTSHPRGRGADR